MQGALKWLCRQGGLGLDLLLSPPCPVCKATIDAGSAHMVCRACAADWPRSEQRFPRLRGLYDWTALWPYEGPVIAVVRRAKQQRRSPLTRPLASSLSESLHRCGTLPVLAVPPSRARRHGGWHLAQALVRELVRTGSRPARIRLFRRFERPAQTGLRGAERRRNLLHSFGAQLPRGRHPPTGVCLIDDVLTTGATLRESARALRAVGVREVHACVLARVAADRKGELRRSPAPA